MHQVATFARYWMCLRVGSGGEPTARHETEEIARPRLRV
jgi:hypothetical protein